MRNVCSVYGTDKKPIGCSKYPQDKVDGDYIRQFKFEHCQYYDEDNPLVFKHPHELDATDEEQAEYCISCGTCCYLPDEKKLLLVNPNGWYEDDFQQVVDLDWFHNISTKCDYLVTNNNMEPEVRVIENIISDEDCDRVINWLDNDVVDIYDFNNKVHWLRESRNSRQFCLGYASKLMEKEFIRRCDLVRWDEGVGAGVHVDNHQYYEDLTYSAVIYMNDEFEGGETIFPKLDIERKPKKGSAIIFPSHLEHGVNLVTKGKRYSMNIWYTRDEQLQNNWLNTGVK